ncbi:short-chain dehydrogenase [Penicillium atrosanguineum]|uniref:Short-chain dehydrogenase n=1 Tax=Penicillium atrosanguineum TaxID=1132637 RepID=A0A9W9GT12_9EURO|nr:choline transport protein [Penicillium atrosanguineum]KAJ5127792.1 short-chain dehydrogenase [Penicillium atrosanguineum]KAJ5148001.1 short-chain dehydrogenase [Penicillium atrosanguineum]KAJ5313528.1 choline transport protein [Penicillium atrosanguineum]KAJ5330702.1 short-chain dehydrogenase [Penicillium atrosanguineum]
MPSIKNSTVLVIGGSSGIGYGVAEKALAEHAKVHIASSNASRVRESTETLQEKFPEEHISGHLCDLADSGVERNLELLLTTIGPLDHIVFTAGDRLSIQPLDSIDLEAIHRAGHIRFAVPLLLAKLAPRFLKPGYGSSITLTTGSGSQKPYPNWSLITGYLTGLHGMVRNLALDLKPTRVNLVSPGVVATPLWGPAGVSDEMKNSTALRKAGTIEEVSEAYLYLMKDTNATGSCVSTNAGSLLL